MGTPVLKPFYGALKTHGEQHPEVVVVTNDLTASCEADGFRDAFPTRHISAGMAEQALVSALSGLAAEGSYPIYTSFAVFCTRRPYEQIALTLAYPAKKATLVGFLPGLMTPGGVTHQAVDDLGLMTQLPNMTVIEAADATDMETVLDAVYPLEGPAYIRGLRGEVPRLFDTPLQLNKHRTLFEGKRVLVVVSGHLTPTAKDVVGELHPEHPDLGLVNVSTLKPFDDQELIAKLCSAEVVITVENHWVSSGLARIVGQVLHQEAATTRLISVGVGDTFTHGGSVAYLEEFYGISRSHIARVIRNSLGITTDQERAVEGGGSVELTAGVAEGL